MEVQVESAGGLSRRLHVTIPGERLEAVFSQRIKTLATRARVPGFRPGKAPLKVIEKQYGDGARQDAVGELIQTTWPQALQQVKLQPVGEPAFEVKSEALGQPLSYSVTFEVFPEIVLGDLSQIAITRPNVAVTDADVERLIDNLRRARRTLATVERAAQKGDVAIVDFEGKLDGVPFNGGKGENQQVELGDGRYLPDLENGIVGHAAGETFEVPVAFPADYRNTELAGKTTSFTVSLKEVKESQLPELNEEFLKTHGIEAGGADELTAKCRSALESERDKAIRMRVKIAIMDQLVGMHPLDVPAAPVEQEIDRLRGETANRMGVQQNSKIKPEQLKQMLPAAMFEAPAKRRVALGLLLAEVIKKFNITTDQARVEKLLADLAADYEQPEDVFKLYRSRPDLMQGLQAVAIEEQVVEALVAGGKVSEETLSLEDLLKAQNQAQAM